MEYRYPNILRRYMATVIDGVLIVSAMILVSYLFQGESRSAIGTRVGVILFMFFIYEPLFTSRLCTLGQRLTGIRVRKQFLFNRISIPAAYLRIVVKLFLGIFSFFTIPFTEKKRAIHDFAVDSVVVYENPS